MHQVSTMKQNGTSSANEVERVNIAQIILCDVTCIKVACFTKVDGPLIQLSPVTSVQALQISSGRFKIIILR